jgi:hypothetical protein
VTRALAGRGLLGFNSEPNKKLPLTRSLASRGAGIRMFGGFQKLALLAQDKGEVAQGYGVGAPRNPAKVGQAWR